MLEIGSSNRKKGRATKIEIKIFERFDDSKKSLFLNYLQAEYNFCPRIFFS